MARGRGRQHQGFPLRALLPRWRGHPQARERTDGEQEGREPRIDRGRLEGTVDLVTVRASGEQIPADREIAARPPRADLAPDAALPDDTRLWAALQHASGGVWGGCVYDADAIATALAGLRAKG